MPARIAGSRAKNWCFTSYKESLQIQEDQCNYYIYGKETCPKTKRQHLQGYIQLINKKSLKQVKIIIGDQAAHLEVARGSPEESVAYCSKEDSNPTVFGNLVRQGQRSDLLKVKQMVEEKKDDWEIIQAEPEAAEKYRNFIHWSREAKREHDSKEELKQYFPADAYRNPLQMEISTRLADQNDRQILWVYDRHGNTGKTWLAKWLVANVQAFYTVNAKVADIAYAYNNEDYFIMDLTRSMEGRVNYGILESMKNGILFSAKYTSKQKIFVPPQVLVLANFMPDETKLSQDRWDILNVEKWLKENNISSLGNTEANDVNEVPEDFKIDVVDLSCDE